MSRPGYSLGAGVRPQSLIVPLVAGPTAQAFAALTVKAKLPQKGKIIGIDLNFASKGGTHSTSTVDVQDDGVSLLGAPFDVAGTAAGTTIAKEGSDLAAGAAAVAKDSVLSVVLAEAGGSSPTWGGASVQIDYIPLGD